MTTDLSFLSATETADLYRQGKVSPVEVTSVCLDKIYAQNSTLNAFCLVDVSAAMEAARASEKRFMSRQALGPLDGIPVAIKDLLLTKAWPTLRGSKAISTNQPWDEDAPAVARLREGGAILLGKTTTPEFGWKAVTDSPLTGVTYNPWDMGRTPGGSSGGSAAALAAGMTLLALGSDGGGSIRIPASFTGTVGLKPTSGRVPLWPPSAFGTMAHHGPLARTVQDIALLMDAIAVYDRRDVYAISGSAGEFFNKINEGIRGVKMAFSAGLGGTTVNKEVAEVIVRAIQLYKDAGISCEAAEPFESFPPEKIEEIWRIHWLSGLLKISSLLSGEIIDGLDPGFFALIQEGKKLTLPQFLEAASMREALGISLNDFFHHYDLLLTPTVAIPPFAAGLEVPENSGFSHWWQWSPFSLPFNLTRHPAISIPCGLTADGLPIGLQIVGRLGEDGLVLRAARAFELILPFPKFPGQI